MGKFSEKVWADDRPHPSSNVALALKNAGVQKSADLVRVLGLPRRILDLEAVEDVTEAFRKEGGTMNLRGVQSAALLEAEECGGLVGAIGVGWGKTLILLLMAEALKAERAVLLVPPDLKRQLLERDVPFYRQHFDLPFDRIAGILSYAELSVPVRVKGVPRWWQWACHVACALEGPLARLRPDAIIADEAHRLRRRESARTRTFLQWMNEHPETKFVALSGSLTQGSIRDCWTLAVLALRKNAPLPLQFNQMSDWANALDPPREGIPPMNPGALWLLCDPPGSVPASPGDLASRSLAGGSDAVSVVREGFRRRLAETPGWVATRAQAFDGSLYVRRRRPKVPPGLLVEIEKLRATWEIGGEEISEAMRLAQVVRRLACGFYHKFSWPGGVADQEYLDARRDWRREVRDFLKHRNVPGMLTELNLANAAASGRWESATWDAWNAVRKRWPSEGPPKVAVWVDDYLVRDALAWARKAEEGLIWFQDVPLGEEVAKRGGFPFYGEGTDAGTTNPKDDPILVVSTGAQSEGKNLQAWSRNLVLRPSASAKTWEQVIGRTHRPGQEADEVWFDVEMPTEESDAALATAIVKARHAKETQGQEQKLLIATFVD
jgi:hypothetical protein